MKLIDTLAILQYMGGMVPNHFGSLMYGIFVQVVRPKEEEQFIHNCKGLSEADKIVTNCKDLHYMIAAHVVCIGFYIIKKYLSSKNDYSSYVKTYLTTIVTTLYMFSLLNIQYYEITPKTDALLTCIKQNERISYWYE